MEKPVGRPKKIQVKPQPKPVPTPQPAHVLDRILPHDPKRSILLFGEVSTEMVKHARGKRTKLSRTLSTI